MQPIIFTIGHSTHTLDHFTGLLALHEITAVCDVRSAPYSRMNPQFNRENLERSLSAQGIQYRFLGKELGARSDDPACYNHGRVDYDRLAASELFQTGLARVLRGTKDGFRIALMCAEKEPLDCHRTILVSRHLIALDIDVRHIHASGTLESHTEAMSRLARTFNLPEYDLFRSREELWAEAYDRQGARISYELAEEKVASKTAAG